MPLVTICTKPGLNDLASDTQDPCADQGQKPVIKSLFICLSCGFPFPSVRQVLCHLHCALSLAEWWGQQPLLVSEPSFSAGARPHPLYCMSSEGGHCLPRGSTAVQDQICSTHVPNMRCSREPLALHRGSSTLHHSLPRAQVCRIHPDPGWHLHLVKHGSEGSGTICHVGGYPRKALDASVPPGL